MASRETPARLQPSIPPERLQSRAYSRPPRLRAYNKDIRKTRPQTYSGGRATGLGANTVIGIHISLPAHQQEGRHRTTRSVHTPPGTHVQIDDTSLNPNNRSGRVEQLALTRRARPVSEPVEPKRPIQHAYSDAAAERHPPQLRHAPHPRGTRVEHHGKPKSDDVPNRIEQHTSRRPATGSGSATRRMSHRQNHAARVEEHDPPVHRNQADNQQQAAGTTNDLCTAVENRAEARPATRHHDHARRPVPEPWSNRRPHAQRFEEQRPASPETRTWSTS